MENNSSYLDWFSSPYYHQLFSANAGNEAEAFINQLVQHLNPSRNSRILDSNCGQGSSSLQLASMGFEVTGVDASPANIEQALPKTQGNPEFYLHDVRLPFWGSYFQLAVNLFEGCGYYRTRREQESALRTIVSSLQSGGLLVIDYPNTHYKEANLAAFSGSTRVGEIIYEWQLDQNETHFLHKISIKDPALAQPLQFAFQRAKFSLGDFTDMLSFQKMQVQEVFGDYQMGAYHLTDTPRLIVVGKK